MIHCNVMAHTCNKFDAKLRWAVIILGPVSIYEWRFCRCLNLFSRTLVCHDVCIGGSGYGCGGGV